MILLALVIMNLNIIYLIGLRILTDGVIVNKKLIELNFTALTLIMKIAP